MTLKLYELTDQYRRLLDEDDEEYTVALDQLEGAIAEKACSVAAVRAELLAEAEAVKVEVDRLTARMRARQNRADALRDYLYSNMVAAGLDNIKDARFSLRIQVNSPSVDVLDVNAVPERFRRIEISVDRRAILEVLKSGEEVPGAELVTNRTHLVIR